MNKKKDRKGLGTLPVFTLSRPITTASTGAAVMHNSIIPDRIQDGTHADASSAADMQSEALRALRFWFSHYPNDVQIVVSHGPHKTPPISAGFQTSQLDDIAERYAYAGNAEHVYVRLSALAPSAVVSIHQRGKKELTDGIGLLWIDFDPDGSPNFHHRVLDDLHAFSLPPSYIDSSGRGIHALWKVPYTTDWRRVERVNKWLISQFVGKADKSTWNADRIFRLPGTLNCKPEVQGFARILELHDDRTYDLDDFGEESASATSTLGGTGFEDGGSSAEGPSRTDDDIEASILASSSRLKYLRLKSGSYEGYEGGTDSGYDRSDADAAMVMLIARFTYDFDQIDRIFRRSQLVRSDGWEREQYRQTTIRTAVAEVRRSRSIADAQLTDRRLAAIFADRHGDDVLYDGLGDYWLEWDGTRYRPDDRLGHQRRAVETVDYLWLEVAKMGHSKERDAASKAARQVQSHRAIQAMIRLARSEDQIATSTEDLDNDPYLLNTQSHTLELRREGGLVVREHRRSDLLTKVCAVEYDPDATCPVWDQFLDETFGGDQTLIRYFRQLVGYSLLGIAPEKLVVFCYGPPDTAKTTALECIDDILGNSYSYKVPSEMFLTRMNDRASYYFAQLRGGDSPSLQSLRKGGDWPKNESRNSQVTTPSMVAIRQAGPSSSHLATRCGWRPTSSQK